MALDLIWRVTCCGEPIYVGMDQALANRIFGHWANTPGHDTKIEQSELNWWRISHSPVTEGAT